MYGKGSISGPNNDDIFEGEINFRGDYGPSWQGKIQVYGDSKEEVDSIITILVGELNKKAVKNDYAKAFNSWMDDFVNNPSEYESSQDSAIKHLKEKLNGEEPSYGQVCEQLFKQYLGEE